MRILFLIEDWPITPYGYGGGSAIFYSHLSLLIHSRHDISIAMFFRPKISLGFQDFVNQQPKIWEELQKQIKSYKKIIINPSINHYKLAEKIRLIFKDPIIITHSIVTPENIQKLRSIIDSECPDIIWAEHRIPAILAIKAGKNNIPIIYSHHDWEWKIAKLRNSRSLMNLKFYLYLFAMRKAEETLVREVNYCISASLIEVNEIKTIGAKKVVYFPVTYPLADFKTLNPPLPLPRIVHLGGMRTTATRRGLERFLDIVWPKLIKFLPTPPQLIVIGDLQGQTIQLAKKLHKIKAICTGYIPDLNSVLRPYDIYIIPWEYSTGVRTRLPLAFNFAQAVIATKASVSCFPEVKNGYNCILVDRLSDMVEQIVALYKNESVRKTLGDAARQTFLHSFTQEATQERFNKFLEKVCSKVIDERNYKKNY